MRIMILLLSLYLSLLSNSATAVVFGDDDRVQVFKPTVESARVGLLKSDVGICTASIIDHFWILTAAHCVYSQLKNKHATWIEFYPGLVSETGEYSYKENNFFYPYFSETVYIHKVYFENLENLREKDGAVYGDLALVKLRSFSSTPSLKKRFGAFPVQLGEASEFSGVNYGYPKDKPFPSLWRTYCRIENWSRFYIGPCDTYLGQSGGPLLRYAGSTPMLMGVLSGANRRYSFFSKITTELREDIMKIIAGRQHDQDNFRKARIHTPAYSRVSLHNVCYKPLHFAVRYLDRKNNWIKNTYFFKSGQKSLTFISYARHYYIYAQDTKRNMVLHGGHSHYFKHLGFSLKMAKMDTGPGWKNILQKISCR